MKPVTLLAVVSSAFLISCATPRTEIKVMVGHNGNSAATPEFKFKNLPSPAANDSAVHARFSIVDGERDENGGSPARLHDDRLPSGEDQPEENFFFAGAGGRVMVDFTNVIDIAHINSYSWHTDSRAPQVYKLYASDGAAAGFNSRPKKDVDPAQAGWKFIASVDTRPKTGGAGGQYGVSISSSGRRDIGKFRYLLFDISPTETEDGFGNTFYSEIDVIARGAKVSRITAASAAHEPPFITHSTDGYCEISIDTSQAPDLKKWAQTKLAPALAAWYPKIVALMPSDGFDAPKKFSVTIRPGSGVAATGGTRVTANSDWLKNELNGQAVGSIIHEEVHVVQQYGRARRGNPDAKRAPGWLVEGIPDYIRWYKYEPKSHGAEITRRSFARARYDARYRITANFLNFVVEKYGEAIITRMNAACRDGKYSDDLWSTDTGKTIEQLNDDWKAALAKKLGIKEDAADGSSAAPAINTLTRAEQAAGWKILFNGTNFDGWHNFKSDTIRAGWEVKDGALVCSDPHNAGDIVTSNQYDWFELQLDYNISEAGNSGIMYHVTDEGNRVWATGPEFQLEDNQKAADPVRCGWLYALYQPPIDPKTGKTLDATKPVGEWNHVRLLISPQLCEHDINGVKYFEYVLGSDDFNARIAKSKFSRMPRFAKSNIGYLALQGDHGQVMFRNIKIRPIQP